MIWSSVGLLLAVSLVNTKGLSIHGEEGATIQGDEVEQELEVSEVMLLGGITDLFHNCEQNIINCFMRFLFVVIQVLEGMLGMGGRVKRDDRGITNYDIRWVKRIARVSSTYYTYLSIREALIQMLKAMRAQDKKEAQAAQAQDRVRFLKKVRG